MCEKATRQIIFMTLKKYKSQYPTPYLLQDSFRTELILLASYLKKKTRFNTV